MVDKFTKPPFWDGLISKINEIIDNFANYLTINTAQNITGVKTFVGQKMIGFKQSGSSDKLGFTLYNNSGTEKGYLEYNPSNNVDGVPLMTLGNYASASGGLTHVGFRKYSSISGASGAYNLLAPLISDAKTPFNLTTTYTNFYLPLGFTDGSTTVLTAKTGLVDISSLLPSLADYVTNSSLATTLTDYVTNSVLITTLAGYATETWVGQQGYALSSSLATVATSGDYDDLINKPTIPIVDQTYDGTSANAQSGVAIAGAGFLTGITSGDVTTALGYTPVSKAGDTMTGDLAILGNGYMTGLELKSTDYDITTIPTANKYSPYVNFLDENDVFCGAVYFRKDTNGNNRLVLTARNSSAASANLVLQINDNGTSTAGCPTPTASSDNTNIATTEWVHDNISYRANDTVTGDQDVSAFLTSSKQRVSFTVHLPKKLNKISTTTVTKMLIHLRIPTGGYLVSDGWDAKANSTISVSNEGQSINVTLYSTSAFSSYTNNLPICGMVEFGFKFT